MFKLLIGLTVFAVAANATIVSECDDFELPINVDVINCEEEPCEVVRGTDVITNMTFVASDDIEFLETDVLAEALGIPVHFPLPKPCDHLLSGKCPIAAGDRIVYQLKMPILKLYPLIPIDLTFTMKNENSDGLFCFKVALQVVDG